MTDSARGATHYQALRALVNRLVGILHGCLRNHTLYDEHLAWHSEPDKLSPAADCPAAPAGQLSWQDRDTS